MDVLGSVIQGFMLNHSPLLSRVKGERSVLWFFLLMSTPFCMN